MFREMSTGNATNHRIHQAAAARGDTTTHYPHDCVLTANHGDFAATPAAVKRRYATPPPPALTPLDRRYVGYDDDAVTAM